MTINKKNIVKNLSQDLSLSTQSSSDFIEYFLQLVKKNSKKNIIKLSGFGSFGYKKTKKRLGRNPKTRESYIIKPVSKLTFKASNKIKKILN